MNVESIGRSDHPAIAGRHCRSGARQSTPSISIDNCAEVNINVPPGSTFEGPQEAAMLEPLGEEAKPGAIPIDDLDEIGLAAAEHEQVPLEGVLPQHALDQHREPVDALAHVD